METSRSDRRWKRLPALLGGLLACSAAAAPRPVVQIRNLKPLKAGNVCETFLAESEGKTWFFKQDEALPEIQKYGNFEAEVFVGKLFRRLGVLAPQARVVDIQGKSGAYLQTELVDAAFTGGAKPEPLKEWFERTRGKGLDQVELRVIQLVDVLVGNGDRHDGNLFLAELGDGRVLPVPIDHNLALATPTVVVGYYNWHLTQGLDGIEPGQEPGDPGNLLYPHHAPRSGTPERIMRRNLAFDAAWLEGGEDRDVFRHYIQVAEWIRRELPDPVLRELVDQIQDGDVTSGDPRARREEIFRLVRSRRDRMPAYFREYARKSDRKARAGLRWMEEALTPELVQRLGLDDKARTFVGLTLFATEGFDARHAYGVLRAAGVEELLARQATEAMCKEQGVPFVPGELAAAEQHLADSGLTKALHELYESFPTDGLRRGAGAAAPPLSTLIVRAGSGRLQMVDARGQPVSPDRAAVMSSALKAALREAKVRPGDMVRLEREAFAGRPGNGNVYRAWVTEGSGPVRWSGMVASQPRP